MSCCLRLPWVRGEVSLSLASSGLVSESVGRPGTLTHCVVWIKGSTRRSHFAAGM